MTGWVTLANSCMLLLASAESPPRATSPLERALGRVGLDDLEPGTGRNCFEVQEASRT